MVAIPGSGQPITYDFLRQLIEAANKTKETVIKTNVPDEIRLYTNLSGIENPQAPIMIHIGKQDISGFARVSWSPKFRGLPIIVTQAHIEKNFDKNDAGVNVTIGNRTSSGFEASVRDLAGKPVTYEVSVHYIAIGYPA